MFDVVEASIAELRRALETGETTAVELIDAYPAKVVVSRTIDLPNGEGFNAETLEYGNLIDEGILDPVKVTHSAVVNAGSVARMVLTTEASVVDKPEERAEAGHGHEH